MKELKDYFVSHKQAESLKELGFTDACLACYTENDELAFRPSFHHTETNAPLIMQAVDWLTNELGSMVIQIDDSINELKAIRRKIDVTVTLTFEKFFPKNVVYSDGAYLVIEKNSSYPISVESAYGEFISYDGLTFDTNSVQYIAKSFKFTNE